jgi:hypothetical protein
MADKKIPRLHNQWISSLEDGCTLTITCPMNLSADEMEDVRDFAALWLRQLERLAEAASPSPLPREEPTK